MRVIEEFSFDEEPGKTQVKSNITESVEKPNISIVTPFYNAEQNFIQTYYCVVNQSMEAFEWIIVDDGSSRPSAVELSILFRFAVILLAGLFGVPGLACGALLILAMACY